MWGKASLIVRHHWSTAIYQADRILLSLRGGYIPKCPLSVGSRRQWKKKNPTASEARDRGKQERRPFLPGSEIKIQSWNKISFKISSLQFQKLLNKYQCLLCLSKLSLSKQERLLSLSYPCFIIIHQIYVTDNLPLSSMGETCELNWTKFHRYHTQNFYSDCRARFHQFKLLSQNTIH